MQRIDMQMLILAVKKRPWVAPSESTLCLIVRMGLENVTLSPCQGLAMKAVWGVNGCLLASCSYTLSAQAIASLVNERHVAITAKTIG